MCAFTPIVLKSIAFHEIEEEKSEMKNINVAWINDKEKELEPSEGVEVTDKVIINLVWCKGCGICVEFCPKKSLAMGRDGKAHVVNLESCNSCGLCYLRCPDFAIKVPGFKG